MGGFLVANRQRSAHWPTGGICQFLATKLARGNQGAVNKHTYDQNDLGQCQMFDAHGDHCTRHCSPPLSTHTTAATTIAHHPLTTAAHTHQRSPPLTTAAHNSPPLTRTHRRLPPANDHPPTLNHTHQCSPPPPHNTARFPNATVARRTARSPRRGAEASQPKGICTSICAGVAISLH